MPPRATRASRAATAEAEAATARAEIAAKSQAQANEENEARDPSPDVEEVQPSQSSQQTRRRGGRRGASSQRQSTSRAEEAGEEEEQQQADEQGARHQHEGANDDQDDAPDEEDDTSRSTNEPSDSQPQGELPTKFKAKNPDNHLRILLATDNHVGYMERDPVRGQDSITTFREILQLAVERDVDLVLLGGDLFHENKPSRATLHQVMASIREYCMGDKPVSVELLSDPNDGKPEGYSFPAVNYEDTNLNIAIPVFSIHGNHDDPQGVGIDGALSALDLLSVSGLVNYFGKVELPSDDQMARSSSKRAPDAGGLSDVGIRIRPVLLQKGETKLALYGMGNIKDERMHYELRANRVRMYRPRENPDDWFNILCVHQNRAAHNPKACVPETMFDDSVHLVVWGHEHEQLLKPQPVGGKRYHITQPGSSVATSLSPGEAAEKMVGIIHIEHNDFYLEEIPLQTVRPFIMDDMALAEEAEDAGVPLDDKGAVQRLLKNRVYELIDKANAEWDQKHAHLPARERPERMLPLVRLRVEYAAAIELGNPIRFGQEFIDKVANPKDVLQFHKRKAPPKKKAAQDERYAYVDVEPEDIMPAEKFEKIKVGGLVKEFLSRQNLELLNSDGLERAITNFVDKDDRDAIQHFVKTMMKSYQGSLNSLVPDEKQLEQELDRIRDEQVRNEDLEAGGDEDEGAAPPSKAKKGGGGSAKRGQHVDSDDSMLEDLDDGAALGGNDDLFSDDGGDSDDGGGRAAAAKGKGKGRATQSSRAAASTSASSRARKAPAASTSRARGAPRGKSTFLGGDSDSDLEVLSDGNAESDGNVQMLSGDDDDDDDDDDAAPSRSTKKASGRAPAKGRATTSRAKAAQAPAATPAPSGTKSRADVLSRAKSKAKPRGKAA